MHPELRSSSTGEALSHSAVHVSLSEFASGTTLSFLVWPTDEGIGCQGLTASDHRICLELWKVSPSTLQSFAFSEAWLQCRKHVITEQGYIPQLVRCFEEEGVVPVPIFINGIEAHTVVRCRLLLSYPYIHCFSCIDSIPSVPACDLDSSLKPTAGAPADNMNECLVQ